MHIGEIVKRLRLQRGWTRYRLWKESGVSQSNLKAMEDGQTKSGNLNTLVRIARALEVGIDDLMSTVPAPIHTEHDEPRPEHVVAVPIMGVAVGGSPQEAAEVVGEEYSLLHHLYKPGRYVIRLFGDSMHPTYWSNDLLLVDPKEKVKDGDVALVRVDNESTVKRVFRMKKGQVQLQSDNRTFPAVLVEQDQEFKIEGKILRIVEGERP